MFIQYINKESHTVNDGSKEYVFNCNDIKEIPDNLAIYLCGKYRNSFKKVNAPEKPKEIKDVIQEVISYILYTKKANSTIWKSEPVNIKLN